MAFIERHLNLSKPKKNDLNGSIQYEEVFSNSSSPINMDEFMKLNGAIIVAEGGMGKTTFMKYLNEHLDNSKLFELGYYRSDPNSLKDEIKQFFFEIDSNKNSSLIFDGLDEARDLLPNVLRLIKEYSSSTKLWLASRDITAIRAIQAELPSHNTYSLAPFSKENILEMAKNEGLEPNSFYLALCKQDFTSICAKPIGCALAIKVYRANNLENLTQNDIWQKGLERLCDENPSQTKRLNMPSYQLKEIIECAAWIAMCMHFSQISMIWVDETTLKPEATISIEELKSDKFSVALIIETLNRGLFTPVGDGCVKFSHLHYQDYLTACSLKEYISFDNYSAILFKPNGEIMRSFRGVASWLASFSDFFFNELFDKQPELLLSHNDNIQKTGKLKLCNAIIARSDKLSYRQRQQYLITENLFRLESNEVEEQINSFLQDPNISDASESMALAITECCDLKSFPETLIQLVLNTNKSFNNRCKASSILANNKSNDPQIKKFLLFSAKDDPFEEIKGIALGCLWPNHLTAFELCEHLTKPISRTIGMYRLFLNQILPQSFTTTLTEENASIFLEWANNKLLEDDEDDYRDNLGKLAKNIFFYCFQNLECSDKNINILARIYFNCAKARISLLPKGLGLNNSENFTFVKDSRNCQEKRYKILLKIINEFSKDNSDRLFYNSTQFSLHTSDDFDWLLEQAISQKDEAIAKNWIKFINNYVSQYFVLNFEIKLKDLHEKYPALIEDFSEIKRKIIEFKANEKVAVAELMSAPKQNENDKLDKEKANENQIHSILQNPKPEGTNFLIAAFWLNYENDRPDFHKINLQNTKNWLLLSRCEINQLTKYAHIYITEEIKQPTALDKGNLYLAQAILLIYRENQELFQSIDDKLWSIYATELLKPLLRKEDANDLNEVFDYINRKFPEILKDSFINVLEQQLKSNVISIIRVWENRFTDKLIEDILTYHKKLDLKSKEAIIRGFIRIKKPDKFNIYLEEYFKNKRLDSLIEDEYALHNIYCFFNPDKVIVEIINFLKSMPEKGKKWLELIVVVNEYGFTSGLFKCKPMNLAEIYIWLHLNYPPESRPEQEGAYHPGPLDEIYMLKGRILNHLIENQEDGCIDALEEIVNKFSNELWLKDCLLDAKSNGNNDRVIEINVLKKLYHSDSSKVRLISSAKDLSDVVMNALRLYQNYLQGDNPAVVDLWDKKGKKKPKDEDDVSDHLKRFLDPLLKGIIINREVVINRTTQGSRTDLWVQATNKKTENIITLCIEVKCNWNGSAKNAMKNQLVNQYMSGGTAKAGIFLLAWFQCKMWDKDDKRKPKKVWDSINAAEADLNEQVIIENNLNKTLIITAKVIDCEYKTKRLKKKSVSKSRKKEKKSKNNNSRINPKVKNKKTKKNSKEVNKSVSKRSSDKLPKKVVKINSKGKQVKTKALKTSKNPKKKSRAEPVRERAKLPKKVKSQNFKEKIK